MQKRNTKLLALLLAIFLVSTMTHSAFAEDRMGGLASDLAAVGVSSINVAQPLMDVSDISIASGQVYDLTNESSAAEIYSLAEGSLFFEFHSTSNAQYQSIFSVSNPTAGNQDRHFHLYVTPSGLLGMELRNTDEDFKYTMSVPDVLLAGQSNKVAFKADATENNYKLFVNGAVVSTISQESFKFFADITGASNISLGGTVRQGDVAYPFGGSIKQAQVYAAPLSDQELIELTTNTPDPPITSLLLDKSSVDIATGNIYDLSVEENADKIMALAQGTVILSYTGTSNGGVQSLFSIGNSTSGNSDRHLHLYLTNSGQLGMELRNTDTGFKYVLNRPAALQGTYHGQTAVNTVALKADAVNQQYKLFANGELVATLDTDAFKFIRDITGVNNIALGGTVRNNAVAYPFAGTIHNIKIYDTPLTDEELLSATAATAHGANIFYAGDATNSSYYRIPALLTLKSGNVVSSIDARYGGTHDAKSNIDIAFSKSTDGGNTWSEPTLPLLFDDYAPQAIDWPRDSVGKNVQISGSAAFIDTVLLQDHTTERLFLFSDAFSSGRGFNNVVGGTGFKVIDGKKYLKLQWHQDADSQYNYSIRENGIIFNDLQNLPTEYSVDGDYRILRNGTYLTQKQYEVSFQGTRLLEKKTDIDVNMCVFYKDSVFKVLPTNYLTMKYSDDEGDTWSDMKILGDFRDVNQRMVLFGPGVGTQIKNGPYAGRLIISSYNSISGDYGYLYSDNHGDSWNFVNTNLGGSGTFAEAQIVELPDGSLRTYMRTNIGKIGYITSTDGGMTWSPTIYIPDISVASYGTQLSVINYSKLVDGKPAILMSTPTSPSGRRGGTILVGLIEDTGAAGANKYNISWAYRYAVDLPTYGFSYSCMTELPDGRVGILYEKYDSWSRDELHLKNIMRYETYTIEELT